MNITAHRSQIRTLKQGDCNFCIIDGMTLSPRAGFEISKQCPQNYAMIIATCIDKGWIKPIANITERELLFIGLSDD
jgi:hypothetical protein